MKNSSKLPFFALALSLSLFTCNGNKTGSAADSAKVDSSSTSIKTNTDTTIKVDTSKAATDTSAAKTDTVSKTTKSTVIKRKVTKKD